MSFLCKNSKSLAFILSHAKGSWLFDTNGKKYLDAFSSYSSVNYGHLHKTLYKAFIKQSKKVSVFSRTSTSDVLLELCDTLHSTYHKQMVGGHFKTIPMNSGVEACETAVKLARKWGYLHKEIPTDQVKVLFPKHNYWGRSISAISTSDYTYQKHFYPKTPGFAQVPFNDSAALEEVLKNDPTIAAFFVEPVQGEGGINIPTPNYFKEVRAICTKYNVLLICDEIQTGMGRTGTGLCIESYGIQADMILLGKSLGGGFVPVSVCMAREDVADLFLPGEHSSTFGGFPLGCAMGTASLKLLHDSDLLSRVAKREVQLHSELNRIRKQFPHLVQSVRGKGMLFGLQMAPSLVPFDVCSKLTEHGVVTREANHHVVRICPPLNSSDDEMEWLFNGLEKCFSKM